jgi:hypothetical protein
MALEQAFASSSPTVPLVRKTEFAHGSPDSTPHKLAQLRQSGRDTPLPTVAGYAPVCLGSWGGGVGSAGGVI